MHTRAGISNLLLRIDLMDVATLHHQSIDTQARNGIAIIWHASHVSDSVLRITAQTNHSCDSARIMVSYADLKSAIDTLTSFQLSNALSIASVTPSCPSVCVCEQHKAASLAPFPSRSCMTRTFLDPSPALRTTANLCARRTLRTSVALGGLLRLPSAMTSFVLAYISSLMSVTLKESIVVFFFSRRTFGAELF
jgi:hypothetical protein